MISILFKYRLIMNKNRFANMPVAEKIAYALVVLVITAFVLIMTGMCLKKADKIIEFINPSTFEYFNFLGAVVLNLILMAAISIEAFAEVEDIYYRRETQFILQFPNDFSIYFIYKLVEISLKIIPVLVLLFPLGLLYVFFFVKYYGAAVAMNFILYSSLSLVIILMFSSALVMALAAAIARLLSFFRQRTIGLMLAIGFIVILCFYFPVLKDCLTQKSENKNALANIYNTIKVSANKFEFSPVSILAEGANSFVNAISRGLLADIFYSLLVTIAAIVISYYINLIFFFREMGSLLDNMSLRQNSSRSMLYFRPLESMPAVWRGAIYDETCHVLRKNFLMVFIFMVPAIFAMPFYLPPKFFEAVRAANKYWAIFVINSTILMYGSELMAGDLINKRAFMQLLRPMSVKLKDFLAAKIFFYWLIWASLLLFVNSSWAYFLRLDIFEFLEVFFLIVIWSAVAPLICYGVGSLAYAKFSLKKDADGFQPSDPAVRIIVSIILTVMCIGSFRLYNSGLEMAYIYVYFLAWLAASFFTLRAGARALEKKEL
ncbi:MAG TPA: hypothetical protein PKK26_06170 [Candidatus Wallbacteria bacterium]|nr:hypothetical protein [Candidatus Wallbacteria bacterium]